MTVEYTPWNRDQFADLVIWHTTDAVLAEHAAHQAVTADNPADTQHHVDMAELYTLRDRIFTSPNLGRIARSSQHLERQTRDATWIDPQLILGTWPPDRAGAALTAWKAHR